MFIHITFPDLLSMMSYVNPEEIDVLEVDWICV